MQVYMYSSFIHLHQLFELLFLDSGEKMKNPEEMHANTERTCKTTHKQQPELRIEPRSFDMIMLPTVQPCICT